MEIKRIYLIGAAGVAFLFLKGKSGGSLLPTTTAVNPGAGVNNSGMSDAQIIATVPYDGHNGQGGSNYLNLIYPAMLRVRPDVGNPNYQMTDAEAQQYMANYLTLRQALPSWTNFPNILDRARSHWKQYGVAQKLTFLPINPTDGTQYVPPPVPPKKSGGGFWGSLLSVVTTVVPLILGTETVNDLSNEEAALLIEGSGIAFDVVGLFMLDGTPSERETAVLMNEKMDNVLSQLI